MTDALIQQVTLQLSPPEELDARSDKRRLLEALSETFGPVRIPVRVLRRLHGACLEGGWKLTLTLVWNGQLWVCTDVQPGDAREPLLGLCADLGSTTVCMAVVELDSGRIAAQTSVFNHQISWGEDILSRVFYCKDRPDRLEELRQATLDSLHEALERLEASCGRSLRRCGALVLAGNTTMMHFLLGLDPFTVFASPYAPCETDFGFYPANELGLALGGLVYCFPCRANYLGGDIISGMLSTGLNCRNELSVFLDIGTNGELVIGNKDFLMAGAGAAGPALEGGVIRTGMRADIGAVSEIRIEDGAFRWKTIGGAPPKGICGSGIVALLAQMFLHGWVDFCGGLQPEKSDKIRYMGAEWAVCYAPELYLYQSDIDAFLQTKAAANTMVSYLLDEAGIPMEQVDKFYVAGAFGIYLDKESAVTIGLYPDIPREKIVNAGNSSLDGARRLLCCRSFLEDVDRILADMDYIQFSAVDGFVERMRAARAIPHTDLSRYPSVMESRERIMDGDMQRQKSTH